LIVNSTDIVSIDNTEFTEYDEKHLIFADNLNTTISNFIPYSYTGNYLINGTVDLEQPDGSIISLEVTTVFDDENKRIFSGLVGGGGSYVVLENASYVFGLPLPGNPCFYNGNNITGWTYTKEMEEYSKAFHYGKYYKLFTSNKTYTRWFTRIDQWLGNFLDQTTCGGIRFFSNFETTSSNVLYKQTYVYTSYDPVNNVCYRQNSILQNHLSTYRTKSQVDFNQYFVLPKSCDTPLSWCDNFFPSGNPCFN
jgi:hypothetical protein